MQTNIALLNNTQIEFINQISKLFPDRRSGKRGPKPIGKNIILTELFKLIKHGLGWRNISHSTVCRNYLLEIQRRGKIKNIFQFLVKEFTKFKPKKTIIDSTELESYDFILQVSYSGKSHNYSTKLLLEITEDYIPIGFIFSKGSFPDSRLFDNYLLQKENLPYKMILDMGFERYDRRRELKQKGCQIYMEQKIKKNNRKRGPRFTYTKEHKRERTKVERFFAWMQSFKKVRFRQEKSSALFHAFVLISLLFYTWKRKL
jgi:hypothetical protein